jgi:hypothetical protein
VVDAVRHNRSLTEIPCHDRRGDFEKTISNRPADKRGEVGGSISLTFIEGDVLEALLRSGLNRDDAIAKIARPICGHSEAAKQLGLESVPKLNLCRRWKYQELRLQLALKFSLGWHGQTENVSSWPRKRRPRGPLSKGVRSRQRHAAGSQSDPACVKTLRGINAP